MKGRRRVLVVEDDEANLDLASFLLEEAGLEVARARDASSALAELETSVPDLVLLDIHLPDCGGLELLRRIRALPGARNLPVLALTAHAMRGDRERFLEGGFDGYMPKPIAVKTFAWEVLSHLA